MFKRGNPTVHSPSFHPSFLAPELIRNDFNPAYVTEKIDVFSFGVLVYCVSENTVTWESSVPPLNPKSYFNRLIVKCKDENPTKRPTFTDIRSELIDIKANPSGFVGFPGLIAQSLEDQTFNAFLKSEGVLKYEDFTQLVLLGILNGTSNCAAQLQFLLSDNAGNISLEYWKKVVKWFSPLAKDYMTNYVENNGPYTIDFMCEIAAASYFFGFLDAKEAQDFLTGEPAGTFFIRFSSNPKMYALSVSTGPSVAHWRISTTELNETVLFHLENIPFRSLTDLVNNFSDGREALKLPNGSNIHLKEPANRVKYKASKK